MANPMKISGQVGRIQKFGENVYHLSIETSRRIPRFLPGQFLHLTIDSFDPQDGFWPESRVFSIASAPSNGTLEIVYSVKGKYTTRMASELNEGSTVWLKLPYGDFSIESLAGKEQDIILVAGGTGISPFMSYLQENRSDINRRIQLIYGIRETAHLLFRDVLISCLNKSKHFSLDLFVEKNDENGFIENANRFTGMITVDHLLKYKTMNNPVYFLSGPPVMISLFKKGLLEAGIDNNNIKIDEWE